MIFHLGNVIDRPGSKNDADLATLGYVHLRILGFSELDASLHPCEICPSAAMPVEYKMYLFRLMLL